MVFIRNLIGGLLAELEDDIDRDRFKRMLHYSRRLAGFQNRAKLVGCPRVTQFWRNMRAHADYTPHRYRSHWKKSSNKVRALRALVDAALNLAL